MLEESGVFLFNDIFVYATMTRDTDGVPLFEYVDHHQLIDLTLVETDDTDSRPTMTGGGGGGDQLGRFSISITRHNAQEDVTDDYAEFRDSDTISFVCDIQNPEVPSNGQILSLMWQTELHEAIKHAKQPSNKMERFEGAVIFADVSGERNYSDLSIARHVYQSNMLRMYQASRILVTSSNVGNERRRENR